jgi:hypothetical protein
MKTDRLRLDPFPAELSTRRRNHKIIKGDDMRVTFYTLHGRCPENAAVFLSGRVKILKDSFTAPQRCERQRSAYASKYSPRL